QPGAIIEQLVYPDVLARVELGNPASAGVFQVARQQWRSCPPTGAGSRSEPARGHRTPGRQLRVARRHRTVSGRIRRAAWRPGSYASDSEATRACRSEDGKGKANEMDDRRNDGCSWIAGSDGGTGAGK